MKKIKKYLPLLFVLLIIFTIFSLVRRFRSGKTRGEVTVQIGQTYEFIARDENGNPANSILPLTFISATKKDSVNIQGQKATAKNGKVFLVLDFEVKNDSSQTYYLLPVDLIRLLQGEETKIAPSVHQGRLEVRPISSKFSNLGFVIEQKQKGFQFEVGEIDGEKNELKVQF
ncbi:MAG: hypothetical protein FJ044_03470 [Candidatus Cloacimonetes bacterium]|nr:hypothetical protein [Candidatus Cloacimonadota bacterium]